MAARVWKETVETISILSLMPCASDGRRSSKRRSDKNGKVHKFLEHKVDALVCDEIPGLAITRWNDPLPGPWFGITHLGSGFIVFDSAFSLKDAKEITDGIADITDWTQDMVTATSVDGLGKAISPVRERVAPTDSE